MTASVLLPCSAVTCAAGRRCDGLHPVAGNEGYGLNAEALKALAEQGIGLVVTVDNGISAVAEAEYAAGIGAGFGDYRSSPAGRDFCRGRLRWWIHTARTVPVHTVIMQGLALLTSLRALSQGQALPPEEIRERFVLTMVATIGDVVP